MASKEELRLNVLPFPCIKVSYKCQRRENHKEGTQLGPPLRAKQETSLNLSIYHSIYSRHTLALIKMGERKNR